MKEYIKQFVRPSTSVEFYQDDQEFLDYINETYIKTGKCLKFRELSFFDEEKLVLISKSVWTENFNEEFFEDQIVINNLEKLIEYNKLNSIRLLDIIEN